MTKKPEFITFTGADDHTDVDAMVALSDLYPIEWGILFSPKRQGAGRYPSRAFVHKLIDARVILSGHLCGGDARAVIEYGESQWDELLEARFARAQINTADPKVEPVVIKAWADSVALRAILQCRGSFPFEQKSVDYLFDASGGRGVVPPAWPASPDPRRLFGYAGGLNPENVGSIVACTIAPFAGRYWLDMESGVRDANDRFDLGKCRAVCEAVYGPAQ